MDNTILIYILGGIIGLSIIAFAFASIQGRKIKKSKRKIAIHRVKKSSKYSHIIMNIA